MKSDNYEISEESQEEFDKVASIHEIVLRQIKKIGDLCAQELTGGYWQKKPFKVGDGVVFVETYHDDKRQAYIQSVDFIVDLIYASSDQIFKDALQAHEDNIIGKKEAKDILTEKKILFREINKLFERIEYFDTSNIVNQ